MYQLRRGHPAAAIDCVLPWVTGNALSSRWLPLDFCFLSPSAVGCHFSGRRERAFRAAASAFSPAALASCWTCSSCVCRKAMTPQLPRASFSERRAPSTCGVLGTASLCMQQSKIAAGLIDSCCLAATQARPAVVTACREQRQSDGKAAVLTWRGPFGLQ